MAAELIPAGSENTVLTQPRSAAELGNLSTQALRAELAQSIMMTARHLAYLAMIWRELENRGEDLSELRVGLAIYLPQIAAGQLEAETVIRFAGRPLILRSVATLSLDQQRRLAAGEPLPVLTIGASGEYEHTTLPAQTLTAAQARMVFEQGRIRTIDEQRAVLESRRVASRRRHAASPDGRVQYDPKADTVKIGRAVAKLSEVLVAVCDVHYQVTPPAEAAAAVLIKLEDSEHRRIKAMAAEQGVSLQDLVRGILVKFANL